MAPYGEKQNHDLVKKITDSVTPILIYLYEIVNCGWGKDKEIWEIPTIIQRDAGKIKNWHDICEL